MHFPPPKQQHQTQTDQPESLLQFIGRRSSDDRRHGDATAAADVTPRNYRLAVRPVFNSTSDRPYTVYGTASVTFTPDRDQLHSVVLQLAAGMLVNENNVFVYRSRIWTEASFGERPERPADAYGFVDDVTVASEAATVDDHTAQIDGDYGTIATPEDATTTDGVDDGENISIITPADLLQYDIGNVVAESFTIEQSAASAKPGYARPVRHFSEIAVTSVVAQPLDDTLTVSVALPLKRGHFYVIKVTFVAPMQSTSGFQWTGYEGGVFGGTIGEAAGQLAFPHFRDECQVTVDLEVIRPATMKSLATAMLQSTEPS